MPRSPLHRLLPALLILAIAGIVAWVDPPPAPAPLPAASGARAGTPAPPETPIPTATLPEASPTLPPTATVAPNLAVPPSPTARRTPAPAEPPTPAPTPWPTPSPAATRPPEPTAATVLRPNELGKIMVLEYHWIGDEDERWTRSRAGFLRDLEYLYRNGYYLVGFDALYENRLAVPAGKSPVVLTFDDSNRSQFQMLVGPDGKLTVDPASGVGILEEFLRERPDFGRAAVFCVLPKADPPNDLFGQEELRGEKLRYLVRQGYELCNHTWWHQNLRDVDAEETRRQIAFAARDVAELVPGYRMSVFSPPMGVYPKDESLIVSGKYEGHAYHHRVVLEVAGGPLTAPNHRATDFLRVPRIQAIPSQLDRWFAHFEQNPGERYVSDGDPNRLVFPAELLGEFRPPAGARELPAPAPGLVAVGLR